MKIVMFSINPVFPDRVTGGASKHLYHIAKHLGGMGHTVEVVCAGADSGQKKFIWAENVTVFPILPFHLPFPQPYAISGGDLALLVERLGEHLESTDRFYIHDGEFLLPDLYSNIPTIISFRDNIYPESVLGSFIGKADEILCVSKFSAAVIAATAGRFYPDLTGRMHQVNNGIDLDTFKPVNPTQFAGRLGVDPYNDLILLHPHRPEPGKGLPETIRVVDQLVHQYGIENLKILVPEWIESMVSREEAQFQGEMAGLMDELGVSKYFQFIPWVSQKEMPALYSVGRATLCLGSIVEAFGNVAYESLACGTPSVVAKVGVHRTLLPGSLIDKVPFSDTDIAAEKVAMILREGRRVPQSTRDYLQSHLAFETQIQRYADVIVSAEKRSPLRFIHRRPPETQKYILAPWCYFEANLVYHDFCSKYEPAQALQVLAEGGKGFTKSETGQAGVSEAQWEAWIENTWIVPEYNLPEENKNDNIQG